MDKTQICKICNKRFANGKAMGGHMRSHLHFAKLPRATKRNSSELLLLQPQEPQKSFSPPISSSSSSSYSLSYSSESYPKSSMNPIGIALANPSGTIGSSEPESLRNPTKRRSKRRPKSVEKVSESLYFKVGGQYYSRPVSDYSFTEKDAATSLLMLSCDYNNARRGKKIASEEEEVADANNDLFMEDREEEEGDEVVEEKESEEDEEDEEEDEEEEEEPYKPSTAAPPKPSCRGKFRCETCDKGFKSYQALGGHKASHKKVKLTDTLTGKEVQKYRDHNEVSTSVALVVTGRRVFKCSFCDKEFETGQALGGHKKVHFPYLGNNPIPNPKTSATTSRVKNLIDLNLPPPETQEDI